MVTVQTVSSICFICAGINAMYVITSLLQTRENIVPYANVYYLLSAAVSGTSLAADITMLKSINYGNVKQSASSQEAASLKAFQKLARLALGAKLFVIAFDFFAPTVYYYNAAQTPCEDNATCGLSLWNNKCMINYGPLNETIAHKIQVNMPALRTGKISFQKRSFSDAALDEYLKGTPPPDSVVIGMTYFGFSFLAVIIATVVKGVILFLLHDYYEGVKQQGKLTSTGLQDEVPPDEEVAQPYPGQTVQTMPGYYASSNMGGGGTQPPLPPGFVFIGPYPGSQMHPTSQPYPVAQPYPQAWQPPSGANYPRATHFVPHPP